MKRLFVLLAVALVPSLAYANTGIFDGSGQTIKLVHSEGNSATVRKRKDRAEPRPATVQRQFHGPR